MQAVVDTQQAFVAKVALETSLATQLYELLTIQVFIRHDAFQKIV